MALDGFLVLTIAGERLKLSRVTVLTPGRRRAFPAAAGAFAAGLAVSVPSEAAGVRLAGLGLLGLAAWLAACFVSMVFAHAPVIVPAVLGVRLPFHPLFYGHLALLHASLALRLLGGDAAGNTAAWQWGRGTQRDRGPASWASPSARSCVPAAATPPSAGTGRRTVLTGSRFGPPAGSPGLPPGPRHAAVLPDLPSRGQGQVLPGRQRADHADEHDGPQGEGHPRLVTAECHQPRDV